MIKNELANDCLIQKFLLPNKINWAQEVDDIYNNLTRNSIVFDWPGKIEESKFSQINFLEYYENTDILFASNGMQLIKHLTVNKNHHAKIKQIGYSLNEFTHENLIDKWYNKLFKLNSDLDKKLNGILSKFNSKRFICAQIRIGGEDWAEVVDEAYKEFGSDNVIGFKNSSFNIHLTSSLNKTCWRCDSEF